MNPNERGWLKKYLEFRAPVLRGAISLEDINMSLSGEEFLYNIVQPTGLMYGHPLRIEDYTHPLAPYWDEKNKIKVLLVECLLQSGMFIYLRQHGSSADMASTIPVLVDELTYFYQQTFFKYKREPKMSRGKERENLYRLESILDDRTSVPPSWDSFWTGFFHNILLFLDLVYYTKWAEYKNHLDIRHLIQQKTNVRMSILKLLAAASWADGQVDKEELKLYNYFLQSAKLDPFQKKEARTYMEKPLSLEDLDFQQVDNWILRKYFLELAILAIYSNIRTTTTEDSFIHALSERLKLTKQDVSHSILSIESFVVENWEEVYYLQQKENYQKVSERFVRRMSIIVRKNHRRIQRELTESREVMKLLAKSASTELTPFEKEKVRAQLIDILKTIPAFALFMMPGSFLTLPILFRILPKQLLFPSSFHNDDWMMQTYNDSNPGHE
ncbi:MAG: hypothetical protein AAF655_11735 [Bacteroidota bacterium]